MALQFLTAARAPRLWGSARQIGLELERLGAHALFWNAYEAEDVALMRSLLAERILPAADPYATLRRSLADLVEHRRAPYSPVVLHAQAREAARQEREQIAALSEELATLAR